MKQETRTLLKKALMNWYIDVCKFEEIEAERYTNSILKEICLQNPKDFGKKELKQKDKELKYSKKNKVKWEEINKDIIEVIK